MCSPFYTTQWHGRRTAASMARRDNMYQIWGPYRRHEVVVSFRLHVENCLRVSISHESIPRL